MILIFIYCTVNTVPTYKEHFMLFSLIANYRNYRPVFAKTSPKRSFSITEFEHVGLVFTKTQVYKFGHWWEAATL